MKKVQTSENKAIKEYEKASNRFKSIKKKILIFIIFINTLTILTIIYSLEYIALLIPSISISILTIVFVYLYGLIIQSCLELKFKDKKKK